MAQITHSEVRGLAPFGGGAVIALLGLVYANEQIAPRGPSLLANPYWLWGMSEAVLITLLGIYGFVAPWLDLPMPPEPKDENKPLLRLLAIIVLSVTLLPPLVLILLQTGFVGSAYIAWGVAFCLALLLILRPRPTASALREPTPDEVEAAMRKSQEALRQVIDERDAAQFDLAVSESRIKSLEATVAQIDAIRPLIRAYRSTHELLGNLTLFVADMEEVGAVGSISEVLARVREVSRKNSEEFTANHRYNLIKLTTFLKTEYGLLHPALTDETLTRDVSGPGGVEPMLEGLRYLHGELQKMLADAAGNLNL